MRLALLNGSVELGHLGRDTFQTSSKSSNVGFAAGFPSPPGPWAAQVVPGRQERIAAAVAMTFGTLGLASDSLNLRRSPTKCHILVNMFF